MLLKCCFLHRSNVLPRHAIFGIFVSMSVLVYLCLIYAICFLIIIFIFITINHLISLTQKNLFSAHACQKFRLRVLLSFCLFFSKFQPGVDYKSLAYKKQCVVLKASSTCEHEKIWIVLGIYNITKFILKNQPTDKITQ